MTAQLNPQAKRRRREANIQTDCTEAGAVEFDRFCWLCHGAVPQMVRCSLCPRTFHPSCYFSAIRSSAQSAESAPSGTSSMANETVVCFECESLENARLCAANSPALCTLSVEQVKSILVYVVDSLKQIALPKLKDPISTIKQRILTGTCSTTTALHADVKWLVHNSIIYNGNLHRFTKNAKLLEKVAREETLLIDRCLDCYIRYHMQRPHRVDDSFPDLCTVPHVLVWARMRGFPYWPARVLEETPEYVQVRFFGENDRSNVAKTSVMHLSKDIPVSPQNRTDEMLLSINDLMVHIRQLRARYGYFEYAPAATFYSSEKAAYFSGVLTDESLRGMYAKLFQLGSVQPASTGGAAALAPLPLSLSNGSCSRTPDPRDSGPSLCSLTQADITSETNQSSAAHETLQSTLPDDCSLLSQPSCSDVVLVLPLQSPSILFQSCDASPTVHLISDSPVKNSVAPADLKFAPDLAKDGETDCVRVASREAFDDAHCHLVSTVGEFDPVNHITTSSSSGSSGATQLSNDLASTSTDCQAHETNLLDARAELESRSSCKRNAAVDLPIFSEISTRLQQRVADMAENDAVLQMLNDQRKMRMIQLTEAALAELSSETSQRVHGDILRHISCNSTTLQSKAIDFDHLISSYKRTLSHRDSCSSPCVPAQTRALLSDCQPK